MNPFRLSLHLKTGCWLSKTNNFKFLSKTWTLAEFFHLPAFISQIRRTFSITDAILSHPSVYPIKTNTLQLYLLKDRLHFDGKRKLCHVYSRTRFALNFTRTRDQHSYTYAWKRIFHLNSGEASFLCGLGSLCNSTRNAMVSKIPLSWLFVELDFLLCYDIDAPCADHANLVFVYLIISVGWVERVVNGEDCNHQMNRTRSHRACWWVRLYLEPKLPNQ